MIALKRWIVLAPMASLFVLQFTGCQTGTKSRCHQTSCSSCPVQTACVDAKPSGCLTSKPSCGALGCATLPAHALPQQPAVPHTPPTIKSHPPQTEPEVLPQDPKTVPGPPVEEKPQPEANAFDFPFTPEPVTETPAKPTGSPYRTVSQETIAPVRPATLHAFKTRVSAKAVIDPNANDQSYQMPISRPWSDALGLPSNAPQEVEQYHAPY